MLFALAVFVRMYCLSRSAPWPAVGEHPLTGSGRRERDHAVSPCTVSASLNQLRCITDAMMALMRTTVRLDDDVLAAADAIRKQRHIGLSEAVNELARLGMQRRGRERRPFRQRTQHLGLRVDVTNVAEALDLLDEMDRHA